MPIQDKPKLVEALQTAVDAAATFCAQQGIDLDALLAADKFDFIQLRDDAVDKLLADEQTKPQFLALARDVDRLFKAILPHERAGDFGPWRAVL